MANKITKDEIIYMNILYRQYGTYAAVARETKRSPATIKKYIIPDFTLPDESEIIRFNIEDFPTELDMTNFLKVDNFGELCQHTEEEVGEIKELWKELLV